MEIICTKCGIEKQHDQFYATKKFKTGLESICKVCYTKICTKCKTEKSIENYFVTRKTIDEHHSCCKTCWSIHYGNNKALCKCGKLVGKKYMNKHLKLHYHTLIPNKEL